MTSPRERAAGIEHVIGLDIGDGESSLAWVSVNDHGPAEIYRRQRHGERSIITATADVEHRRVIGDDAITSPGARQFSVSFKQAPNAADPGMSLPALFAETLLAEFAAKHPEVVENCVAYVGHPAGWPDDAITEYRRQFATLNLPVHIMPESQSALLHIRDGNRPDRQRLDKVLVIDIGSSTTDFTLVEDLEPINMRLGSDLGCRQIDEELAQLVCDTFRLDEKVQNALRTEGGPELLLLACRWAKEAQFTGDPANLMTLRQAYDERFVAIVGRVWTWLKGIEIPALIGRSGGWQDRFHALLWEASRRLHPHSPNLVVLTGGGSRMPMIRGLCRVVFPDAEIESDVEPAFAVARGLASNGRHRVNVDRFRSEIAALTTDPALEELIRAETTTALEDAKTMLVKELKTKSFDDREFMRTFGDSDVMRTAVTRVADDVTAFIADRAREICRRYAVPDEGLVLKLRLPDIYTGRIARILHQVDQLGAISDRVGGFTKGALGFTRESRRPTAIQANTTVVPAKISKAAVAAIVAVSGVERAAILMTRGRVIRAVRNASLSPDQTQQVVEEVLQSIATQMDERVRDIERYLA